MCSTNPSKRSGRLLLNIMTDRMLVRRQLIQQDLERAAAGHADTWRRVTREWRESTEGNPAWLTYAANYLFSFAGYKWALDPFAMSSRVNNLAAPDYRTDLGSLSLIVLTHEHNDHLDLPLIHDLSDMDIQWVIPSYLQEKIGRESLGRAEPREDRDQRSDQDVRPLTVDEHIPTFGHTGVIPVQRDPGPDTRAQVGRVPDMVEVSVCENNELE